MNLSRTHVALGAAGVVTGLTLGVTGLAHAVDPTPSAGTTAEPRQHLRGPMGGMFRGLHMDGYGGLVAAVGDNTLTLRTPRGTEKVALSSSTAYYLGKDKATASILVVGKVVHVRLVDPRATNPVAAVVTVVPAHLVGWVTAIGSSSLTVTDMSGFTRTLRTSGTTTYLKDGASSTRDALTVGTLVRAVGAVDSDGTTLDATRVATGRPTGDRPGPDMMDGAGDGPGGAPAA